MPFFSRLEVFSDKVARSAAVNMALDEVFWQTAATPRLRLYEWDHRAISFGYFGRYADVAVYRGQYELVRRCTGGGIVFHGNDLTYALVIPTRKLGTSHSPLSIYSLVHEAIRKALLDVGVSATLLDNSRSDVRNARANLEPHAHAAGQRATATESPAAQGVVSNACFANPVAADVMVDGEKVAGAAQRRSRRGLLQQGSIQEIQLPEDFRERFARGLSTEIIFAEPDPALLEEACRLGEAKYQSEGWLKQR